MSVPVTGREKRVEVCMPLSNFPQEAREFEIQKYHRPHSVEELIRSHVCFSGSPLKHPLDSSKVVLVVDPASSSPFYYEFSIEDIGHIEELSHIVRPDGENITMARMWIKRGSVALRCLPFVVEEIKGL